MNGTFPARTRKLFWTILVLAAVGLYEGWNLATDHLHSPSFSAHARFHAALGGIYLVVLSFNVLGLAWGRFGSVKRPSELLLVFNLLALPGGPLLALALVPAGAPPAAAIAVAVIALVGGLSVSAFVVKGMRTESTSS